MKFPASYTLWLPGDLRVCSLSSWHPTYLLLRCPPLCFLPSLPISRSSSAPTPPASRSGVGTQAAAPAATARRGPPGTIHSSRSRGKSHGAVCSRPASPPLTTRFPVHKVPAAHSWLCFLLFPTFRDQSCYAIVNYPVASIIKPQGFFQLHLAPWKYPHCPPLKRARFQFLPTH